MEKRFLVKFKRTKQVGPDDWDYVWTEKLFSDEATLKEIKFWVKEELSLKDHINYRINVELTEPK